jgi:hypothetical protein
MQGKLVDMDKLMQKHELTQAVGNANMNARGDKLGPGGKIIKTREQMVAEYYESNPKAVAKNRGAGVGVSTAVEEEKPLPKAKKPTTPSEE